MASTDVYRALWRHKLFIGFFTAILALAAWYFTSLETETYSAGTLVRIEQPVDNPGQAESSLVASQQLARTYAAIIEAGALNPRVASLLSSRLGPRAAGQVSFSAELVEDLDLMWIRSRSPNPGRAALVANAAAQALRSFIAERETARDRLLIVTRASPPTEPSSPNIARNVVIAVLIGLVLNGALALALELFSDRLPEPDELEAAFGKPVLGAIPPLWFVSRDIALGDGDRRPEGRRRAGVG